MSLAKPTPYRSLSSCLNSSARPASSTFVPPYFRAQGPTYLQVRSFLFVSQNKMASATKFYDFKPLDSEFMHLSMSMSYLAFVLLFLFALLHQSTSSHLSYRPFTRSPSSGSSHLTCPIVRSHHNHRSHIPSSHTPPPSPTHSLFPPRSHLLHTTDISYRKRPILRPRPTQRQSRPHSQHSLQMRLHAPARRPRDPLQEPQERP